MEVMPCLHKKYCQHRLYEKCRDERVRKVAEMFPHRYVEAETNSTLKNYDPYKSNIPTLAYEKYINQELDIDRDENFVKDFYANGASQLKPDINIIQLTEKQMEAGNAYVLCEQERLDFLEREKKRIGTINQARNKAIKHFNEHFDKDKKQEVQSKEETKKFLKKLYTKLQEAAEHIVNGEGEGKTDREKEFLMSKEYLNGGYLAGIKIKKPKNAMDILEEIRILLQKHKLRHENEREQIEANKSMSQSFMSESSVGSNDSQSRISQATGGEKSQMTAEQAIVNEYCDLIALKKKWKQDSITKVKQMIRKVVFDKLLKEAQQKALQDKLKAQKNNELLMKQNPELAKRLRQKQQQQKQKKKQQLQSGTAAKEVDIDETNTSLRKDERDVKEQWMRSGKYNPTGELFQRTNNYTKVFNGKLNGLLYNLELRETADDFNRDSNCICTCKCDCGA